MNWLDSMVNNLARASGAVTTSAGDHSGSPAAALGQVASALAVPRRQGPATPDRTKIVPAVAKAVWGEPASSFVIPMSGPRAGFVVGWFDQFPDPFRFWLHGKVVIGDLVPNPPRPETLRVEARFRRQDNPGINGEVSASIPIEADGSFAVPVHLFFGDTSPRPWRLTGAVSISGTTAPVEHSEISIETANLNRFIELVDAWERSAPLPRLQFVAQVRKVTLTSPVFDLIVSNHAKVPPLYANGTDQAARVKAATKTTSGQDLINISHVLVGIEAGDRQKPQPKAGELEIDPKLLRVDLALTWAGDFGKALTLFLAHRYFKSYFDMRPDAQELQCVAKTDDLECLGCLTRFSAVHEDLIGDVDGVNMAAVYDPILSLADNLRAYYGGDARRRYGRFLERTLTADGQQTLMLAPGGGVPRLSDTSRQFIAREIGFATWLGLAGRAWENRARFGGAMGVIGVLNSAPRPPPRRSSRSHGRFSTSQAGM